MAAFNDTTNCSMARYNVRGIQISAIFCAPRLSFCLIYNNTATHTIYNIICIKTEF